MTLAQEMVVSVPQMSNVKCANCFIEFYAAPFRLKANSVCCSKKCSSEYKIKNRINKTNCIVCSKEIPLKPYHKKRYKGPFCCSRECRSQFLKIEYKGENNPNNKYTDNLIKFFVNRCKDIKRRAIKYSIPFDLDWEYLKELYDKQLGLCYYSKIPLKITTDNWNNKGQADLDVISLDKVEPKLGYVKGNLVFCCNGINRLKGNSNNSEFMLFIDKLIENRGKIG